MKLPFTSRFMFVFALIVAIPLGIVGKATTQPSPPEPTSTPLAPSPAPGYLPRVAPMPPSRGYGSRDMERAWRNIHRADREAYQLSRLAAELSSAEASGLVNLGDRLLDKARRDYEAGNYFQAAETALAAKDIYEAAETLYEGELGYVWGPRGAQSPSRSYYDAPFRVAEYLSRAEAEAAYYNSSDSTAIDLLRRARELARPAELTASTQPTNVSDFTILTSNRAAIHLAKAATHLMRAERGF